MAVIFFLVAGVALALVAVPFVLGARRKQQAQTSGAARPSHLHLADPDDGPNDEHAS